MKKREQKSEQKKLTSFFKQPSQQKKQVNPEEEKKEEIKSDGDKLSVPLEMPKEGRIYSWNVNGIRAVLKSGKLRQFLEEAQPHCLCLNETKIDAESLQRDRIVEQVAKISKEAGCEYPSELQFWNCCKPPKKGYSGTAILLSKSFAAGIPTRIEYDFGKAGEHDQEGRVISCFFDAFTLVASYVPNSGVDGLKRLSYRVDQWDKDIQHFLKEELEVAEKKPVIWCGDLNVAHNEIDIYGPKGKDKRAGFTP